MAYMVQGDVVPQVDKEVETFGARKRLKELKLAALVRTIEDLDFEDRLELNGLIAPTKVTHGNNIILSSMAGAVSNGLFYMGLKAGESDDVDEQAKLWKLDDMARKLQDGIMEFNKQKYDRRAA